MLSAQLNTSTVNFETLRRLHSVRMQLQEEAERVRLDTSDDGAFVSHIHRLAARCSPQQLAADVAFLEWRCSEAEAEQQLVSAHFLQLMLTVVQTLAASRDGAEPGYATEAGAHPGRSTSGQASSSSAAASPSSSGQQHVALAGVGGVAGAVAQLQSASASPADRAAALEALCAALEGPERSQVAKALTADGGVSGVLRLLAIRATDQRRGALRLLTVLLAAEPGSGGELVAARGVPVLVHLLNTCLEGAMQRAAADAAARRRAEATAAAAEVVALSSAGRSPARRKGPGGVAAAVHDEPGRPGREEEDDEEDVCLLAAALLRQLSLSHAAELVAAGVVKTLCRMAGTAGGGRLASAAATALSDLACDGSAVVQMLQERLLVSLSDLRLSGRSSECAAALACAAAILQHPARLADTPRRHQQQGSQDGALLQQLCGEMGRACDAASVSALLDLAVESAAAGAGDTPAASCPASASASIAPGLWQLLPFCVHSAEGRAAVLRHNEALRLLLARVADGDAAAAATLRRVGNDDGAKTAVVRQLSKALTAASGRGGGANCSRAAAVALCLADVLRPASRDRSTLRWSAEACGEVEQCGLIPPLLSIAASPEAACRAAGLAALHALAVYGSQAVRTALGAAGGVVCLVDAVKLVGVGLPEGALQQPPICAEPHTLGQAAAEALAAIATASDALRQDVAVQLAAFLGSSSPHLAASACQALLALLEAAPAAGAPLVAQGVMPALVARLAPKPLKPSSPYKTAADAPDAGQEVLQQRAVRLLWALCRGGGAAVDAAVAAGAPAVLLLHVAAAAAPPPLRVEAAAALGPLLKKSAAAREAVADLGGLAAMIQLTRGGGGVAAAEPPPLWEEAMGALAALAALHGPSRGDAARALRQMLLRPGTAREAAAAAVVVERLSSAAAGREAVLADELSEPLLAPLPAQSNDPRCAGDGRTKAAAANAICHLVVPQSVTLPPCAALPAGGAIRPRLVLIRAGAVPALLALLRDAATDAPAASASASVCSAASPSKASCAAAGAAATGGGGGAQTSPDDAAIVAAVEALESLAGGAEGVQAIRNAGGVEVLKATVARGKRRLVPAAAAKAASAALLQCV
ncbi:hypothetical protein PLESTB_000815900 [Pleodorina starrii]|uniref:Uncharacterized protein n=1 Tax=Pleodorina starrii TaxID=330485 RepID=A0A9W6F2J1_9CHLO|nr:hypothetical protein PLESTB_000815900 [Pleodorina starrii]GLC64667.1 hypothetical protein PLESTF_000190400 [Pleodorina starrii]